MKARKSLLAVVIIAISLCLLSACGDGAVGDSQTAGGDAVTSGEPVKIGLVLPLSGTSAFDGQSAQNGAKAAAEKINEEGGVLGGRPIELVFEDSATDPAQAASAAEKLASKDGVAVLVGAFNSSSTGAVMPVAAKYEIPLVTGLSTSPTLTEQGNPWFFRAVGTSKLFVKNFAPTVCEQLGVKKFAYIYENGDWGRNSVAEFQKAVTDLGGQNLTEQVVNSGDADLYTQLTAIKNANPDAIYAVSNLANAVRIAQQAKELGIDVPIIGEGAWASSDFFKTAGNEAAEGIYGLVEYLPEIDTPLNPDFTARYQKIANKTADKYAACEFNTILLIADAINRSGDATPASIRDALKAADFQGLTGPMKFDESGQGYGFDMYLSHNENGEARLAGSATLTLE